MSEAAKGRPAVEVSNEHEAPETLEGWYVLHDVRSIDWAAWRDCSAAERQSMAEQLAAYVQASADVEKGDGACFQMLGHKGDIQFVHYRENPQGLQAAELALDRLPIADYLVRNTSYVSVVEASLYEATAIAHRNLAMKGLNPKTDGFAEAFDGELAKQKQHLHDRVFGPIPDKTFNCFYPMNKRRGESVNWYDMSLDDRRKLMRGHGRLGHKYADRVKQVVSGSVGFDDWEWGVDLYSDDALVFKKLVYEMRFDPASSRFAEFGAFTLSTRLAPSAIVSYFTAEL